MYKLLEKRSCWIAVYTKAEERSLLTVTVTSPSSPSSVDFVILSHAHIDHSGNLPTLVRNGYRQPIYTTPATVDLCLAMLADSAYLQEKDVEFCNRRREHRRKIGRDDSECAPLYTPEDAAKTYPAVSSRCAG